MTGFRRVARVLLLATVWACPARSQEFMQTAGNGDDHRTGGDEELPWLAEQTYLAPFPAGLRLRHAV